MIFYFVFILSICNCIPAPSTAPVITTTTPGVVTVQLVESPQYSTSLEIHRSDCVGPDSITDINQYVFINYALVKTIVADSNCCNVDIVFSDINIGFTCSFYYRGINTTSVGPFSPATSATAAGVPDWGDDQTISAESLGTEAVTLSWPEPPSAGAAVTGYELHQAQISGGSTSFSIVLDGKGYPSVKSFTSANLIPQSTYQFNLYAFNSIGRGNLLSISYTVQSDTTIDPSKFVLDLSNIQPIEIFAGDVYDYTIQAVHPLTKIDETVGGDCNINLNPNCVPNRNFIYFFVGGGGCVIDQAQSICVHNFNNIDISYSFSQILTKINSTTDLNTGKHSFIGNELTGPPTGIVSLVTMATFESSLLSQFWDNINFFGSPTNISVDTSAVNHFWGLDPIVGLSADYVAVRWTGVVLPPVTGEYTLYCNTSDYCRIYLGSSGLILDSWGSAAPSSSNNVKSIKTPSLIANEFVQIVIEFIHFVGNAYIHLSWEVPSQIPKSIIPTSSFHRTAFTSDSPVNFLLKPSIPSVNSSKFQNPLPNVTSCKLTNISIFLFDLYGNPVEINENNDYSEISIISHFKTSIVDDVFKIAYRNTSMNNTNEFYTNFTFTEPGEYELRALINGSLLNERVSLAVAQTSAYVPSLTRVYLNSSLNFTRDFSLSFKLFDCGNNQIITSDILTHRFYGEMIYLRTNFNCSLNSSIYDNIQYCDDFAFYTDDDFVTRVLNSFTKSYSPSISIDGVNNLFLQWTNIYRGGVYKINLFLDNNLFYTKNVYPNSQFDSIYPTYSLVNSLDIISLLNIGIHVGGTITTQVLLRDVYGSPIISPTLNTNLVQISIGTFVGINKASNSANCVNTNGIFICTVTCPPILSPPIVEFVELRVEYDGQSVSATLPDNVMITGPFRIKLLTS